jgi:uncharacterized protein YjbJ (UPF0337 family)
MGEFIDKAKGAVNEAIGKARVDLGRSMDSPEEVIKGAKQEAKGKAQKLAGDVTGALGNKL